MELRKDYLLDRWVIISEQRGARPREFKKEPVKAVPGQICYFCPGNEHLTPPEISRLGNPWKLRVFPNKFPAVQEEGSSNIRTDNTYFTFSQPFGRHEVIAETPDHDKQLWDLSLGDLNDLLGLFTARMEVLAALPKTEYVVLFKNHGKEAGTSLVHSHSQMLTLNFVPTLVQAEADAAKRFGRCPYCEIIGIEKGSHRRCFENEHFVAFTPYASRFNFEIWIFPKAHVTQFTGLDDQQRKALADILQRVLFKLREMEVPFNLFYHISPKGEDLHFHIEVCPRISTLAGFEYCTDATINSVSPETAAKFYRNEL
ncbi:MAG: galactose-1-phosphate uridylyltransferase [Nanoarchaeota archaeon]